MFPSCKNKKRARGHHNATSRLDRSFPWVYCDVRRITQTDSFASFSKPIFAVLKIVYWSLMTTYGLCRKFFFLAFHSWMTSRQGLVPRLFPKWTAPGKENICIYFWLQWEGRQKNVFANVFLLVTPLTGPESTMQPRSCWRNFQTMYDITCLSIFLPRPIVVWTRVLAYLQNMVYSNIRDSNMSLLNK